MTFRLTFFLLVFANLIFYTWAQGHFGPVDPNREPGRLTAQLQPEKLSVVGAQLPPAAPKPAELACRRIEGLAMAEAESLKAAALKAGVQAELLPQVDPTSYLVLISDLASDALSARKVAELKRLGVSEMEPVVREDGGREIVLGRFREEAAANEHLAALNKRGVRSARVEARDAPPSSARIELRGTLAGLPQLLPTLIAPFANAALTDCAK